MAFIASNSDTAIAPKNNGAWNLPLSTSIQHLDPARRPIPVSNDLQWSSIQSLSSIPPVEWFVRNRTQYSLKLVCPYKFSVSPSPGRGVFKMITNSLRHYSETPSFSFDSNSFVESSLALPTEGHYNFATHYSSVKVGSMTLLVIRGCGLGSCSIEISWIASTFKAAQPKSVERLHTYTLILIEVLRSLKLSLSVRLSKTSTECCTVGS